MNHIVRNSTLCGDDWCDAKKEIAALKEQVAELTQAHELNHDRYNVLHMTYTEAYDQLAAMTKERDRAYQGSEAQTQDQLAAAQARIVELREALIAWATLIEFQYTGGKEAMTHLQICDNIGQEALEATK